MAPPQEIPTAMRAVIIAYRFDVGVEYKNIAEHTGVHHEAVKSLSQRVLKRSEDNEQPKNAKKLEILLQYIDPDKGRPRKESGSD